jgi:hypothetical protein
MPKLRVTEIDRFDGAFMLVHENLFINSSLP